MSDSEKSVKLVRGTAKKIATRFGVSINHVSLCIKGERKGKPSLMKAIERERQKQQQAA